jgi:hypothetical protein
VQSKLEMKKELNIMIEAAVKGSMLFNTNTRWPQSDNILNDTLYFTSVDTTVGRLISSIHSALCNQRDAFKQLAELRLAFSELLNNPKYHWDRDRAERNMSANWDQGTNNKNQF